MPRIALLMAGEFRTFKLAFPSWIKNLAPHAEIHLFLSTWNTTSLYSDRKLNLSHRNKSWRVERDDIIDLVSKYNVTLSYLNIEDPINFEHRGNNQIYHWQKTITKLINEVEQYDFAILTRPDVILQRTKLGNLLTDLDKEKIYSAEPLTIAPSHLPYVVTLYDIFFMSSAKNIVECFLPIPYMSLDGKKIKNNGANNMHIHLADYFVSNRLHLFEMPGCLTVVCDENFINNPLVVVPVVGKGTRLKNLTQEFNKALLPYKDKPIISHIIDSFSDDTTFIIPVGYQKEEIKNFIESAYPGKNIILVDIDDFESDLSGPGYTLRQCENYIDKPFWYIPCDTYFEGKLPENLTEDCFFVKPVDSSLSTEYTMFNIENNKIIDIQFKKPTNSSYQAFTGVMYIQDYPEFFYKLNTKNSKEVIDAIPLNGQVRILNSWQDMGNYKNYTSLVNQTQDYDFTKTDEYTYFVNNKVVKYFKNPDIAKKKYDKAQNNIKVYPDEVRHANNWLCYNYVSGTTFYEHNDTSSFERLLTWLDNEVWIRSSADIDAAAFNFYKTKTQSRINLFLQKHDDLPYITHINDIAIKPYQYYIDAIDYDLLCNETRSSHIHGDLHFDNLIVSGDDFKIIDWRHEFGENVLYGDIYYDIAKMYGGLILDYTKIKKNNFSIKQEDTKIYLDIPHVDNFEYYKTKLVEYIVNNGYNLNKIKMLVPIIYWNMSPLHAEPFDKFLWYLGMLLFQQLENENLL